MNFKLDENLPAELGGFLRGHGHDAHSVLDEHLGGASDQSIAGVCQAEQRILLTLDLDFANIRNYPPEHYHGIIILRLAQQDRDAILAIAPRILELLRTENILKRLWIVDESKTRIRGE